MVGVSGFEPPAPASRRRCSTRLSYTPTVGARYNAAAGGPQAGERNVHKARNSQATRTDPQSVNGPIYARTFGLGDLDNTFGPPLVYDKNSGGQRNLPPSEGLYTVTLQAEV